MIPYKNSFCAFIFRYYFIYLAALICVVGTDNCHDARTHNDNCIDLRLCPPANITVVCTLEYSPVCGKSFLLHQQSHSAKNFYCINESFKFCFPTTILDKEL